MVYPDGVAFAVGDEVGVEDAVGLGVATAPLSTSPIISFSPTAIVIAALLFEVIANSYTPLCATAL